MGKRKGRSFKKAMREMSKKTTNPELVLTEIVDMSDKHRVTLMGDHSLEFPELYLHVFIHGSKWEQQAFAPLFARGACWKAKSPEEADFVVFTGGPDLDPRLYGEDRHPKTVFDSKRDDEDINVYMKCLTDGIPMVGICRGAQFGHVMNGGKLYQHIEGHNGDHQMLDLESKENVNRVSSVHHQACVWRPEQEGMKIVAIAIGVDNTTKRWYNSKDWTTKRKMDVEAFFYRETCFFGVQGHPEYRGYNYYAKWFLEQLNNYIVLNPDLDWSGEGRNSRKRLKPDILSQRNSGIWPPLPSSAAVEQLDKLIDDARKGLKEVKEIVRCVDL